MQNKMQNVLALGLVALVAADNPTTIVGTGNNIFPTQFPVTAFPETTQTHFDSPACSTAPSSKTQELTVNYNFETVERGFPITALTPIGVYNLLNFQNINFVDTDPDFDGNHLGLAPYTYPYAASFSAGNILETLLGSGPVPVITANYSQSTLKSFTPHSWWYGCVLPSPYTAGSLPANCTITAQGYDFNGNKVGVATQTFAFATNGSIVQDQNYATFNDGFKGIYSLAFSVDNDVSAALVDNFIATVTQDACAPYYTGSYNNKA